MKRSILTALCAAALLGPALQAQTIDTLAIRGHTRFLAHDLLAGRGTGSTGDHLAAAYIESQLVRLGLEPLAGDTSYLLPVPLRAAIIGAETRATLVRSGREVQFRNEHDFVVNTGGPCAFRDFAGRVIIAGAPASALDALRALPGGFRGAVIAVTAPLAAAAPTLVPALIEGGASGVVVLVGDSAQFDLFVRSRGDRRFFVNVPGLDPVWQPELPVILAGPALTRALLVESGVTAALLRGEAGAPAQALGRELRVHITARIEDVAAANVAGVLPGADAARRNEYIVYSAHFYHLGISVPDAAGDSIYNGFSDNAAGVGMLLAIAEALRESPPPVSVVFLFVTGEERGLLGATYAAARPPFPLERIRALINLDAGAPPAAPVSWRIAGGAGLPLGETAAEVARAAGWTATLSGASPNSDYWPFLARGVPAVFIIPGGEWENVTAEQRDALRRRWDRYHQPGDHWAHDFPFAGLGRYAEYALRLGLAIAQQ